MSDETGTLFIRLMDHLGRAPPRDTVPGLRPLGVFAPPVLSIQGLKSTEEYKDVSLVGVLTSTPSYCPSLTFQIQDRFKQTATVMVTSRVNYRKFLGLDIGHHVEITTFHTQETTFIKAPNGESITWIDRVEYTREMAYDSYNKKMKDILTKGKFNASVLFSNRSAVYESDGQYHVAAMDAITALYLDPSYERAYTRAVRCLTLAEEYGAAKNIYDMAKDQGFEIPFKGPRDVHALWLSREPLLYNAHLGARLYKQNVNYHLEGNEAIKCGNLPTALECYNLGLKLCIIPSLIYPLTVLGEDLVFLGCHQEALAVMTIGARLISRDEGVVPPPTNHVSTEVLLREYCPQEDGVLHAFILGAWGGREPAEIKGTGDPLGYKLADPVYREQVDLCVGGLLINSKVSDAARRSVDVHDANPKPGLYLSTPQIIPIYRKHYGFAEPDGPLIQRMLESVYYLYKTDSLLYRLDGYKPVDLELKNRHQSWDSIKKKFVQKAALGDVFDMEKHQQGQVYPIDKMIQSYTNYPEHAVVFNRTERVVAIGYGDLQILGIATYPDSGWVDFTGVEASLYASAKYFVILKMMETQVSTEAIVEAWYSSAWSESTDELFKKAAWASITPEVEHPIKEILLVWAKAGPVALDYSFKKWVSSFHENGDVPVFAFSRDRDTADACHLFSTGQLVYDTPKYGSRCMFQYPVGAPNKMISENVLHSLRSGELCDAIEETGSLLKAIRHIHFHRVKKIKKALAERRLIVKLLFGKADVHNLPFMSQIAMKSPTKVFWNNCLDYVQRGPAHMLTHMISDADCIHYAVSLNWRCVVHGSSVEDYPGPKCSVVYAEALQDAAERWDERSPTESKYLRKKAGSVDSKHLTCEYLFRKYYKNWLNWFVKPSIGKNKFITLLDSRMEEVEAFHKPRALIYFSFKFTVPWQEAVPTFMKDLRRSGR